MTYFDNAATTPLTKSVIKTMTDTMNMQLANPSSIHAYGRLAQKKMRQYRHDVASLLRTSEDRIIFTSGGTESNNSAIKGYALAHQSKGKHIISTSIEHHSVLHTLDYLEKRFGYEITYLTPVNGYIRVEDVLKSLRDDTILVSMMYANNETGDLLPISEVGKLLQKHQAVFHVDAVQTAGKISLEPEQYGIDFMSISAHKFHGPKGVGILYHNPLVFDSLIHGGEQEGKHRAGTENLVAIAGMTQAFKDSNNNLNDNFDKVKRLSHFFLKELQGINYYLNSNENTSLPHIINIGFPGVDNNILLTRLDLNGFAVSTGSACTAGTVEPSHVLKEKYGHNSSRIHESIRISFSELNTEEEVQNLAHQLKSLLGEL